jgi:hypothetical protein
MYNLKSLFLRAAMAFALAAGGAQSFASPLTYHVAINTATLAGQTGYLDFLFLGLGSAAPATATISNLSGNVDPTKKFKFGAPQGQATSTLQLVNGDEFGQGFTFGGPIGFDVVFAGLTGTAAAGIDLSVALLGNDQWSYAAGTTGNVVTFSLQPGAADVVAVDAAFASVDTAPAGAVPEPANLALLATGLLLMVANRRRN